MDYYQRGIEIDKQRDVACHWVHNSLYSAKLLVAEHGNDAYCVGLQIWGSMLQAVQTGRRLQRMRFTAHGHL